MFPYGRRKSRHSVTLGLIAGVILLSGATVELQETQKPPISEQTEVSQSTKTRDSNGRKDWTNWPNWTNAIGTLAVAFFAIGQIWFYGRPRRLRRKPPLLP
jgi:hypothetical protein